ncbi:MAG: hypothetical protein JO060_08980 [Candidatus Eremiobacteraeota bacterium]|nr:hypothetical protein [Candidatus Eremiobacteraeota bacterium]
MLAVFVLASSLLVNTGPTVAAMGCSGADPAITSAAVTSTKQEGGLNAISVGITVQNRGTQGQASDVLQSVLVYQNDVKIDRKGIPPLRPGRSYTATYTFRRSTEANAGTTNLRFHLVMAKPVPPGNEDCDLTNDSYRLKV